MNVAEVTAKAKVLLEALPYIQDFRGSIFVVKYGGSFMDDPDPTTHILSGGLAVGWFNVMPTYVLRDLFEGLSSIHSDFILGPIAESQLRRALAISLGDPMVLLQSPMSATLLGIALIALLAPFVMKGLGRFKANED